MTSDTHSRPDSTEYASHYASYIGGVPDGDIVATLREGGAELQSVLADIPESRGGFRYAEGKWTIREVIGHVIDAERVFAYRALRIARGDTTPLAAFDEDAYARSAGSDQRTIADLANELRAVRESTVAMFAALPEEAWGRRGTASGKAVTVRALAYIAAGHARHHLTLLRERYLAH